MIASIGNNYAAATAIRSSTNRSTATAFSDMTTTSSATGDVATISNAAQAKLADPMARYYGEVPIEASPDSVADWRAAAGAVSKAQGLPDCQYDFTRMNSTQMTSVINDYIGKGVSRDRLNGLMLTASQIQDFNPPAGSAITRSADGGMDVSQWLTDMYRWDVQPGGASGREAAFLKSSVDLVGEMAKVTGRSGDGVASTTAADSLIKLNDALVAFRKEASLTPAQRVRRDVLKTMDLTEDAIKAKPPRERELIEQKIAAEVARRLQLGGEGKHQVTTTGSDTASTTPLTPDI